MLSPGSEVGSASHRRTWVRVRAAPGQGGSTDFCWVTSPQPRSAPCVVTESINPRPQEIKSWLGGSVHSQDGH